MGVTLGVVLLYIQGIVVTCKAFGHTVRAISFRLVTGASFRLLNPEFGEP